MMGRMTALAVCLVALFSLVAGEAAAEQLRQMLQVSPIALSKSSCRFRRAARPTCCRG